jgi:hypothetical protein
MEGQMRIQLELPEATMNRIKLLMNEVGVKAYSDIFGYALTGLEWMVKERRLSRMIVSTDPNFTQVKELSMPILDAILPAPQGPIDQKETAKVGS